MSEIRPVSLGAYLRSARQRKGLSLRDVERETGTANAYVSQIEGGKIQQPSPLVLHKLSRLYGVSYSTAMKLTGYPLPKEEPEEATLTLAKRFGPVTEDEADALTGFLQFLRSRRRPRK